MPQAEWEVRQTKLDELIDSGIEPYPSSPEGQWQPIGKIRAQKEGLASTVGRISAIRHHGKALFIDLTDEDEKLQIYCRADQLGGKKFDLLELLDVGDYLQVTGELFTTKSGELTIKADGYRLLSKALLPAIASHQELSDVETRYRQRALDFKVNEKARADLIARSTIVREIRRFLDGLGFLEVQTPILQPIAGGAAAKPFVTRYNILEADFYLRIAPELYLKRLVAGGFNRVYEIGPSFRNEGLSHMHNPEFTSCEFYWAYRNYRDLMEPTQKMIQQIAKAVLKKEKISYQGKKINLGGDWPIRPFVELVKEETGIDVLQENTVEKLASAIKARGIKLEGAKIAVWEGLVDELYKTAVRPKIIQPIFLTDHPLGLSPLAKAKSDNPALAERFQLVMAGGFELVNAYSELNNPLEQEKRFKEQMKLREAGWEEGQQLDANFIEALKFGMPPTAGWGLGVDRLAMILTDNWSIKEVIAFPTLRPKK